MPRGELRAIIAAYVQRDFALAFNVSRAGIIILLRDGAALAGNVQRRIMLAGILP